MIFSLAAITFLLWALSRVWSYYTEHTQDVTHLRMLEPWYWFLFLNLVMTAVTSNYDLGFIGVGLLIQVALGVWFAVSIGWIIGSCPHQVAYLRPSLFERDKRVRFCYRCGTRLPDGVESNLVENHSAKVQFFQMPPHLLEYVSFWVLQSLMVLISLFLVLRVLKQPEFQNKAVLGAVALVILVPPSIYFWGRFRAYLKENQGMIWWQDLRSSVLAWAVVLAFLWYLVHILWK